MCAMKPIIKIYFKPFYIIAKRSILFCKPLQSTEKSICDNKLVLSMAKLF